MSSLGERPEDVEHTFIYVDMLGFGALTEQYRTRVIDEVNDEEGLVGTGTSPMQNRINAFYRVIDQLVFEQSLYGLKRAMLFSDCAFIDGDNPLFAAHIATRLMRDCIKNYIPVRMSLAKGTFYSLGMSTVVGDAIVSRSRFIGTAIVRAHRSEDCGGKGMRIFVHDSLESERARIENSTRMLKLETHFKDVHWELDYLYPLRPVQQQPTAEQDDLGLFRAVAEMNDPSAPAKVRLQYTETLRALNRMRKANNRKAVRLRNVQHRAEIW